MEKSSRISLRVTPTEKEAWEKAAGGSVSTWLRDLANNASAPTFSESTFKPGPVNRAAEKCPRWMHHRPGVYCGSCNK